MKQRHKQIKFFDPIQKQVVERWVTLTGQGPKRFRERNCNLESSMVKSHGISTRVDCGDSLEIVPATAKVVRSMERSIRMQCCHSNVIFRTERTIARDMLEELSVPYHRPRKKLTDMNKRKRAGRKGRTRYGL